MHWALRGLGGGGRGRPGLAPSLLSRWVPQCGPVRRRPQWQGAGHSVPGWRLTARRANAGSLTEGARSRWAPRVRSGHVVGAEAGVRCMVVACCMFVRCMLHVVAARRASALARQRLTQLAATAARTTASGVAGTGRTNPTEIHGMPRRLGGTKCTPGCRHSLPKLSSNKIMRRVAMPVRPRLRTSTQSEYRAATPLCAARTGRICADCARGHSAPDR